MKISELDQTNLTERIESTLGTINELLGLHLEYDYKVETYQKPDTGEEREVIKLTLKVNSVDEVTEGDEFGGRSQESLLIGYHGQTLERLQHLISLSLSRHYQGLVRVILDINGYRGKRASSLENLARRAEQQVIETGQEMELQPMSAADRRIIHNILSSEGRVKTESTGEGRERRIVVKPLNLV
jgi:predicted RNA-binding protein Jag